MDMLTCDVCGGTLEMQPDGIAICDSCGMKYSLASLKKKVQEIRGSVQVEGTVAARQTGTTEDVEQWRVLMRKYLATGDFAGTESVVKKILEAAPQDEEANELYDKLAVWKYLTITNGVLEKYTGNAKELELPTCVTCIGLEAFSKRKSLQSITIPEGVTKIGGGAFEDCTSLQSITIPDSVTEIGRCAFFGCTSLQSITIPDSVEGIGDRTFSGCTSLQSITIPDGVTEIGQESFYRCTSLQSITIPDGVTEIGRWAFNDCTSLQSITIPDGVTKIANGAFSDCKSLHSITIPNSETNIEMTAFHKCTSLQNVICPNELSSRFMYTPWWEKLSEEKELAEEQERKEREKKEKKEEEKAKKLYRDRGVCQYCGGNFKGLLVKKCESCGMSKDY